MTTNVDDLKIIILKQVDAATSSDELEQVRVGALGRSGSITTALKTIGTLPVEERKAAGAGLNAMRSEIEAALTARKTALEQACVGAWLPAERLDLTLPNRPGNDPAAEGRIHPVSQVMEEIAQIFADMGFTVAEGPDIEDDFHNFTALNIPPEHPARQMHDTFYFAPQKEGEAPKLLRTHTSPVQIRTMRAGPPPYRVVIPGRTFRSDSDLTHTPMFHQIEGLVIDRDIHMGHLKGVLEDFCKAFFEVERVRMRFRPSHFPFTEPSAEVDIGCSRQGGELRIGEGEDWLEILGCGMVHPKVLQYCNVDPEQWQGFAWGMGIDRIAMLKYGAPDLRAFFESDLRWLRHYGFLPLDVPTLGEGLSR
jgi:phenylalanyl-tRNA synthetase alpha chain